MEAQKSKGYIPFDEKVDVYDDNDASFNDFPPFDNRFIETKIYYGRDRFDEPSYPNVYKLPPAIVKDRNLVRFVRLVLQVAHHLFDKSTDEEISWFSAKLRSP